MKCIYSDLYDGKCDKDGCSETSMWNIGALCADHLQEVKGIYGHVDPVEDFVKVHVLLQFNTEKCLECIKKLGDEMITPKSGDDPRFLKGTLKLSLALEYYEGYCWFPANRVMFTDQLSSKDFLTYVKYGFNKDPGAGPIHGDQTHRLQWHVIMRCMTNNFKTPIHREVGWNHSPLGLFYEYTQGAGSQTGAWAKSMDRKENEGWGNPDKVGTYIIKANPPKIKQALLHRMQKMGGANIEEADLALNGPEFQEKFETLGTFHNELISEHGVDDRRERMKRYADKKVSTTAYEKARDAGGKAMENVLIHKPAPDTLVEINRTRVELSKVGFNTDYKYSACGAEPSTRDSRRW